jgi:hypothetical protein
VNDPAALPAVYSPEDETVPPVAVHVADVFAALVTVAVNWRVALVTTEADVGETETETTVALLTVTVAVALADPPALVAVSV